VPDDVDPLVLEERDELIALHAGDRHNGSSWHAVGEQCPGDVHTLATWVETGGGDSLDAALSEAVQLDGAVEARVESDSDDHVRTTVGPASSISSAISSASPMSLITVSIASRSQT